MRACLLGIVLVLSMSLPATADEKEFKRLQGDWQVVSVTLNGETIKQGKLKGKVWRFDGNKVTALDTRDESTLTLDATTKPPTADIKDKDGKVVLGNYKFVGDDRLTICGRADGIRPKEFDASKHTGAILFELERVKK
jgi:uncharacterized protein (TIGR03067 family)